MARDLARDLLITGKSRQRKSARSQDSEVALRINLVTSRATVAFNDYIVLPLPDLTNGTLSEIVPQFGDDVLNLTGISASKCDPQLNPIP
jgi:hypothetical protein